MTWCFGKMWSLIIEAFLLNRYYTILRIISLRLNNERIVFQFPKSEVRASDRRL